MKIDEIKVGEMYLVNTGGTPVTARLDAIHRTSLGRVRYHMTVIETGVILILRNGVRILSLVEGEQRADPTPTSVPHAEDSSKNSCPEDITAIDAEPTDGSAQVVDKFIEKMQKYRDMYGG